MIGRTSLSATVGGTSARSAPPPRAYPQPSVSTHTHASLAPRARVVFPRTDNDAEGRAWALRRQDRDLGDGHQRAAAEARRGGRQRRRRRPALDGVLGARGQVPRSGVVPACPPRPVKHACDRACAGRPRAYRRHLICRNPTGKRPSGAESTVVVFMRYRNATVPFGVQTAGGRACRPHVNPRTQRRQERLRSRTRVCSLGVLARRQDLHMHAALLGLGRWLQPLWRRTDAVVNARR